MFATNVVDLLSYGDIMRRSYANFIVLVPLVLGACAYEAPAPYPVGPGGVSYPDAASGPVYYPGYATGVYGAYPDDDPAFVGLGGGMWGGGHGGGHWRGRGGEHWRGGGGPRGGVWHGGGGGHGGGGHGGGGHR